MKKYPKYKYSGVEWLEEIPSEWGTIKIKFTDTLIMGQSPESKDVTDFEKGLPFLQGNAEFTGTHPIPKNWCENANKIAVKNDLLLSVRAPVGALNISDQTYGIGRGLCAIRAKKNNLRFLYYLLSISKEELNKVSTGTTFVAITIPNLSNLVIPKANPTEQLSIVQFLDYKTSKIDHFIANRQNQIELLKEQKAAIINKAVTKGIYPNAKMKDSGIEWIGEVPEHWCVSKVKFVAKVKGRIGFRGYTVDDLVEEGEGALTLGATHINKDGGIDLSKPVFINWRKYYESPEIMVEKDDILVVQRGSVGIVGIVYTEIGYATINPSLVVLKKVRMNKHLLFLQLRSKIIKEAIVTIFNETAVPMLSQNQISNFNILLPLSNEEQEDVIRFIKSETSTIDTLITKYQKQIDLMQEYRTALISQAVTGKIDVRNWKDKKEK